MAALDPRVEPRVHERDGFAVTLWTFYQPLASPEVSPAEYADALQRLHAGMREVDVPAPRVTDRIEEAQGLPWPAARRRPRWRTPTGSSWAGPWDAWNG